MTRIRILPESLANKIAAGEVVERPASVVKELVENSLDAGATKISVEVLGGGKQEITVVDNGSGMGHDDAILSLERHATSKIADDGDLFAIKTLGFRGEALPAIASVSHLEIVSCRPRDTVGTRVWAEGGVIRDVREMAVRPGTTVTVSRLFYNTPARLKFTRGADTEFDHIESVFVRMALAHPEIHVRLYHDDKEIFDFPPSKDIDSRLRALWGTEVAERLIGIDTQTSEPVRVHGFLSPPDISRSAGRHVHTFINGRWVNDPLVRNAVFAAYRPFLTKGRYPLAAIFLELDPGRVDVNVHPTKNEVRFAASHAVYEAVRNGVYHALLSAPSERLTVPIPSPGTFGFSGQTSRDFPYPQGGYPAWKVSEPLTSPLSFPGPLPHEVFPPLSAGPETTGTIAFPVPDEETSGLAHGFIVLAQLGNAYIVCQASDGLVIIDQHAAHERIVFEKLRRTYSSPTPPPTQTLIPMVLDLSRSDYAAVARATEKLGRLGLTVEPFGGTSIVVKATPAPVPSHEVGDLIAELADSLQGLDPSAEEETFLDRTLMVMACHGSVRARQQLSMEEMKRLVDDLARLDVPLHCPHGRPILTRVTYERIERDLKRR